MAITRSTQNWTPGQAVKVGFLGLVVVQCIPTPGDFAPDAYILKNAAGTQLYKFVPHNGLEKLSVLEARELIAGAEVLAERRAEAAIARARQHADVAAA